MTKTLDTWPKEASCSANGSNELPAKDPTIQDQNWAPGSANGTQPIKCVTRERPLVAIERAKPITQAISDGEFVRRAIPLLFSCLIDATMTDQLRREIRELLEQSTKQVRAQK